MPLKSGNVANFYSIFASMTTRLEVHGTSSFALLHFHIIITTPAGLLITQLRVSPLLTYLSLISDMTLTLQPFEQFWQDHYSWLQERGYTLRTRYKPNEDTRSSHEAGDAFPPLASWRLSLFLTVLADVGVV